jgi:hypothetical protein
MTSWAEIRTKAITLFRGEAPRADTEQEIIDSFQIEPQLVISQIERVGDDLAKGKEIRSAWAVVRANVIEALRPPPSNPTVDTGNQRDRKIQAARNWIANAGHQHENEEAMLEDLFDGLLADYANDAAVREAMRSQYRRHQREEQTWADKHQTERLAQAEKIVHDGREQGLSNTEIANRLYEKRWSRAAVTRLTA